MQHYIREEYYNDEESCYTESYYKREADRELRNVSEVMNGLPLNKQ